MEDTEGKGLLCSNVSKRLSMIVGQMWGSTIPSRENLVWSFLIPIEHKPWMATDECLLLEISISVEDQGDSHGNEAQATQVRLL